MEKTKPCRCCLSQGAHKDLNCSYIWLDQKEIYADMLHECFNIILSPSVEHGSGICDMCISTLRASLAFKQGVLYTEQELNRKCEDDEKPLAVKLEPKYDNDGDDSDDYFLVDAVRDSEIAKVKLELESEVVKKKPARRRSTKNDAKKSRKSASNWSTDGIKTLVNKLSVGNSELTIKKKSKVSQLLKCDIKPHALIVSPEAMRRPRLNFICAPRTSLQKTKHRENLTAILKYSNAIPFKDRSLLGYICAYCDKTFPDPLHLREHTLKNHWKERLNFKTNFDMTEYNAKFDVTDLTCSLCSEKFANLNGLKEHLVRSHDKTIHSDIKDHMLQFKLKKGDVFDCAMCSATYETFKMLKQHMNKHYSNYTCPKCESSFATKRSLNAHRTTHLEGSFKCDSCDKVFASKAKKQYHEKSKHMGTRSISNCPYCNEPFRSYYQRNQHLIKVHNAEAQYKCNICNKSYVLKSLLMYHIKKSHLMERNYQCSDCGYRFFSKKALKAHMVKHTGERNFTCPICSKAYARKYTLREHLRIHNNDRRFKCDVCAISFVQKCSLKSHLLSNHGISMAASDITCVNVGSSVEQE